MRRPNGETLAGSRMPSAAVMWLCVAPGCSFHMLRANSHPCMNQSQGYTPSQCVEPCHACSWSGELCPDNCRTDGQAQTGCPGLTPAALRLWLVVGSSSVPCPGQRASSLHSWRVQHPGFRTGMEHVMHLQSHMHCSHVGWGIGAMLCSFNLKYPLLLLLLLLFITYLISWLCQPGSLRQAGWTHI